MPYFILALLFPLNDVTTSVDNPPRFEKIVSLSENQGRSFEYRTESRTAQAKLHPELGPKTIMEPPVDVFSRVVQLAESQERWKIVFIENHHLRIEAVVETKLMKYKDDLVIEVRPIPDGSQVHMRSKSRVGKSDLGANARRIEAFLGAL